MTAEATRAPDKRLQGGAVPPIRTNHRCVFCTLGLKPTKMKRQYIHYIPKYGRIVVCEETGIRP